MNFKKLAMILAVVMSIAMLTGCTDTNNNSSNNSTSSTPSTSSSDITSMPSSSEDMTSSDAISDTTSEIPQESSNPSGTTPDASSADASTAKPTLSTDFVEIGALDNKPVTWGPGVRKNAAGRSEACDMLQAAYGDEGALFIGPDEKVVYLTFDQGYENGYTAAILDVLKEKNVKGVFFLTGHYINSAPELVKRMIDEGHIIGNHSYGHLNYATATPEKSFEDVKKLHEEVFNKYGYSMDLFRFPEGAFSEQSLGLIKSTGYTSAFWSFAYNDWDPENQMDPQTALKRAVDGAHNGAIYLFHTVGKTNSLILSEFIDEMTAKGYTFGVISGDMLKNQESSASSVLPDGSSSASSTPSSSQAPSSSSSKLSSSSSEASSSSNIFLRPWG